jgi:hypothetical protein
MRVVARMRYPHVIATLALFFALGGSAVAGAKLVITGAEVKDQSLTSADIKPGSLGLNSLSKHVRNQLDDAAAARITPGPKGDPGAAGPQGAVGPQGTPGQGVTTETATGADAPNYQDLTPLASHQVTAQGDYVIFTTLTVTNTGANNEYLNCGYRFNGTINGAAGVDTTAGNTATGVSTGVIAVDSPGLVEFLCTGNGNTLYDITNIRMRIHNLG